MKPSNKIFEKWLIENNISYKKNVKLSNLSWLKAGGINEIMIFPQNLIECESITKFLLNNNMHYYPIGNLSNIIFRDGNFVTPLINMRKMKHIEYNFDGDNIELELESGVSITKLSNEMKKNSITGFEGLVGIPGTIGGGITMNASSYNSFLCEYLTKILVIDETGKKLFISLYLITDVFDRRKKGLKNELISSCNVFTSEKQHWFFKATLYLLSFSMPAVTK